MPPLSLFYALYGVSGPELRGGRVPKCAQEKADSLPGAFDVLAEFWPHLAIILYRIYPDDHAFLIKVFRGAFVTEVAGTTVETIVVMWLFGGLWSKWTLPFKIITPILHVVFSMAQLWGAIIFRRMWKRQEALLVENRIDEERASAPDKAIRGGPLSWNSVCQLLGFSRS